MLIIGLTGPIGGGKSTVAAVLAELGAEVIDCDQLAREATAPGSATVAAIAERFGPSVIGDGGGLDRAAVAARVFGSPADLAALEAIVHPAVTCRLAQRLADCAQPVAVIEAIKLIEAGYHRRCDRLWLVTAPAEQRRARLVGQRGLTPADADRRIAAQGDWAAASELADTVIDNRGDAAELRRQVTAAWQALPR